MPRQKRTSRKLENAELRASRLKAIDLELDFGDSRSLSNLTAMIEQLRAKLDAYNTALSVIDSSRTEIALLEKAMGELSDQLLIGVAFRYGKDSREYEMAGGVRKSERIRRSVNNRLKAGTENQSNNNSPSA